MPGTVAPSTPAASNGSSKMANPSSSSSWKDIAAAKVQSRLASIPSDWHLPASTLSAISSTSGTDVRTIPITCDILTDLELEITTTPVSTILANLQSRTWTSEAVTTAFCKRAAIAHQLTNCLTEIFFTEAIARARELDAHFATTGKPLGPLAGLPISLKDNFNLDGVDSNLGFVAWINDPSNHDSTLVTLLREQGAVLYCKTATPTAMMIAETVSNANGRTLHPANTRLTPGGSSGGESALLAMRGSPLGVGTDIGGSIRIPCSFAGLWGLKPSFGRFPTAKCKSGLAGQEAVLSINGPMCNDFEGLEMYAKAVVDTEPWHADAKCLPIPWTPVSTVQLPTSLTLLMLTNNGIVSPTPPVQRAMQHAIAKLRAAGHNVIEWDASANSTDAELFLRGQGHIESFFRAEGGATVHSIMESSGEHADWVPGLAPTDAGWNCTVKDLWTLQAKRTGWQAELLLRIQQLAGGREFDGIVTPVAAEVSTTHDAYHHIFYTGAWNLMDMPAVVVPLEGVTVDKELDAVKGDFKAKSENEGKVWSQYKVDEVHGLPVCLQVVGQRLREERTLAVAKKVHDDCA
ncbi:Amidase [Kalmanozyma brasiliensis GHG001]|uniref:amidase n=1 Tax=Kalmanozyma brasiliensis (strain GHG001) TaxID=1365824 RepID=V5EVX5_KALBG|nr:Amidase [Kalmanozyma brasiliensis GHG001]EST09650.1 Amidase [Kalmanozyma brasiliensis GHG001]